MAKKLKSVIFGITDVIVRKGKLIPDLYNDVGRLIRYLLSVDVTPIFYGNHDWIIYEDNGTKIRLEDRITADWGSFPWRIAQRGDVPFKGYAKSTEYIRNDFNLDTAEVVYVGSTQKDFQTAVNGNLLFLNATWYAKNNDYGFFFDAPIDIAKFVSTFCLRDSLWHYKIEEPSFRFYALAPYSTFIKEFEYLSSDAKLTAKFGQGHPDFWTKYLLSTIYFSELFKEIDYIAVIPGHNKGSGNPIMGEPMSIFAKCFKNRFLGDLIVRHTTIDPSHLAWQTGTVLNHTRQLSSINLNEFPMKTNSERYKKSPLKNGTKVLVIDDICTNGYSLEAARVFLQQVGAEVINMSWLKTINSDYQLLQDNLQFNPFIPQNISEVTNITPLNYRKYIFDDTAPDEITNKLQRYDNWTWPKDIK